MSDNAQVFTRPVEIEHFRLISLRGRVTLESKGVKFKGGAIRPKIAAELGLKPRDSYETFKEALRVKIVASLAAMHSKDLK
jgi:hypothetical protein